MSSSSASIATRTISYRTSVAKNNQFNPVWEKIRISLDCVSDILALVSMKFLVRQEEKGLGAFSSVLCFLGQFGGR
jgi:phosphatidylinositol phospholipase C delta